jgi:hypothetical protein
VLNVLVPEVVLQSPRVVAVVGQLEPTGMAKHVRVDRAVAGATPARRGFATARHRRAESASATAAVDCARPGGLLDSAFPG